jgi:acetyl esterase/lipase
MGFQLFRNSFLTNPLGLLYRKQTDYRYPFVGSETLVMVPLNRKLFMGFFLLSCLFFLKSCFQPVTESNGTAQSSPTIPATCISQTPTAETNNSNLFRGELRPIQSCQLPPLPSEVELQDQGMQYFEGVYNYRYPRGLLKTGLWWVETGEPRPLVVFNHGNGGNISGLDGSVRRMLAEGYAVLSPHIDNAQPLFPQTVGNLRCALRWARANASRFNLDTSRIVLTGFSMGGWDSSVMATVPDVPELNVPCDAPENGPFAGSIKGVISLSGSYDHVVMGASSGYVQLLLGEQSDDIRLQSLISPACNLNQLSPAFVAMHGVDEAMFGEQAQLFLKRLNEKKIPGIVLTHPGGHGMESDGILAEYGDQTINCTTVNFLRKVLNP